MWAKAAGLIRAALCEIGPPLWPTWPETPVALDAFEDAFGVRLLDASELVTHVAVGGVLGTTDFAKRSAYEVGPNTPPTATHSLRFHR
ncbi:hypothetical protein CKO18_19415 [Rhodoferax fermentans]|uniref:Uncharacterized protein n=1 Tax=Rhodoferax fermentans TaxID=28066 RepID=A0A1T1AVD4_RHOFE|nr:hypothetical protein [Rhodoferax fermentans]OOV07908.1 hypothetical protein RF819_15315 [Rhodoferax fermentans]